MIDTIYIGLDVDSTVIEHCYPLMDGEPIGAIPWLLKAQKEYPVKFLLNTMRSGLPAALAKQWLEERGVVITATNHHPTQRLWTSSPKTYCHLYIDDRGAGTPLDANGNIDWAKHGPQVMVALERLNS